jgi:hypothetical protein
LTSKKKKRLGAYDRFGGTKQLLGLSQSGLEVTTRILTNVNIIPATHLFFHSGRMDNVIEKYSYHSLWVS